MHLTETGSKYAYQRANVVESHSYKSEVSHEESVSGNCVTAGNFISIFILYGKNVVNVRFVRFNVFL